VQHGTLVFEDPTAQKVNIAGTPGAGVTKVGDDVADSVVAVLSGATGNIQTATVSTATEDPTLVGTPPPATAKTVGSLADISWTGVTTVIYTGSETLTTALAIGSNTLIVSGNLKVNGEDAASGSITGSGGTLTVAPGASVVVDKDGTVSVSNISGDITKDVTASYPLAGTEPAEGDPDLSINPAAFYREGNYSARKNLATEGESRGLVTITLKGEARSDIPYSSSPDSVYYDMFDIRNLDDILDPTARAQGYSAVVIVNLVPTPASEGKIKQSNQGLNMWKSGVLSNVTGHGSSEVFKEKTYSSAYSGGNTSFYYPDAIGGFDIILWGGADRKTITLEVTQPSGGSTQKFLIDYSEARFTAASGTGKTVSAAADVTWTGAIKTVTYTGAEPLVGANGAAFAVPTGKTLVIAGQVTGQTAEITVANNATLEIVSGASIDLGTQGKITITADADGTGAAVVGEVKNDGTIKTKDDISLAKTATGEGTIVITGTVTDVAATIALTQNLEIGGSITFNGGTTAFSGGKNVTINSTGKLALGSTIESLGLAVTNNGNTADAITTGLADAAKLTALLTGNSGTNGKVTASAIGVASGSPTLTVPENTALTVTGATVSGSGVLTLSLGTTDSTIAGTITNTGGIIDLGANSPLSPNSLTITNTSGTIKTKTNDKEVLKALVGFAGAGTVSWDGTDAGNKAAVTLEADLALATQDLTIGANATLNFGTFGLTTSDTGSITNSGTINTATGDAGVLTALVGITGTSGKVVLTGAVTEVDDTLALSADLTIDGGSITFKDDVEDAAFSGTKTVTLKGSGALNLGSGVTDLGTNAALVFDSSTGTVTTATTDVGTLNTLLGKTTKLKATAVIEVEDDNPTLAVPASTALTLDEDLTVTTDGVLTITLGAGGSITGDITTDEDGIINLGSIESINGTISNGDAGGTIQTANATMLDTLLDTVTAGTIEVTGSIELTAATPEVDTSVILKIANNKKLTIKDTTLTVNGTLTGEGDLATGGTGKVVVDKDATFSVVGTVTGDVTKVVEDITISGPDATDLLTLTSVKKDLTTTGATNGFVTIKLGGSVGMTIPDDDQDPDDIYDTIFSENTAEAALEPTKAGEGYSAVRITGLFSNESTGKITQYNQAFNMWEENTYKNYIATDDAQKASYGTTGVYKEKSTYTGLTAAEVFDVALWNGWDDESGATPRIIKLEITQPATDASAKKTFLIDFADVEFDDGE
jgi:hypothetical protein